jgi:hypothetical protein
VSELAGEVHPKALATGWRIEKYFLKPSTMSLVMDLLKKSQGFHADSAIEANLGVTKAPNVTTPAGN